MQDFICNVALQHCFPLTQQGHLQMACKVTSVRGLWVVSNIADNIDKKILLVTAAAVLVILLKGAEREEEIDIGEAERTWLNVHGYIILLQ